MNRLNLPRYKLKIKSIEHKQYIFCSIRKKYVVLTNEEFVRQNFIKYLILEKKYPSGLIAVEALLKINNLKKRADIILFDRQGRAIIIVECKAPEVKITQKAFDQVLRYNINLRVDFLIVTNGIKHYCCKLDFDKNLYIFSNEIPDYKKI